MYVVTLRGAKCSFKHVQGRLAMFMANHNFDVFYSKEEASMMIASFNKNLQFCIEPI